MSKDAVSAKFYLCLAMLMATPVLMAADNAGGGQAGSTMEPAAGTQQMGEGKHFDSRINTWVEGTVSSIDYDHNSFIVHGKNMPFASAHAQMRKEFRDRMKNADASQREKIATDVRQEWRNRLEDARKQAANEPDKDFNLKFAADAKVKDSTDFPFMSMLRQRREMMQQQAQKSGEQGTSTSAQAKEPELVGEFVIVEVYEMPQNVSYDKGEKGEMGEKSGQNVSDEDAAHEQGESAAEEAAEHQGGGEMHAKSNLGFRDLKAGDKVMTGFDDSSTNAYLIIRENKTGTPTSTKQPSH